MADEDMRDTAHDKMDDARQAIEALIAENKASESEAQAACEEARGKGQKTRAWLYAANAERFQGRAEGLQLALDKLVEFGL